MIDWNSVTKEDSKTIHEIAKRAINSRMDVKKKTDHPICHGDGRCVG